MSVNRDNILKKLIFLLLLFVAVSSLESQVPGSESTHQFDGETYTLRIENSPFQIVVTNPDHDVLKVNGIIADNGSDENIWKTAQSEKTPSGFRLTFTGSENKFLTADIILKDNGIKLSLFSSDKSDFQRIGCKFDIKTSGHWYGGAVVKAHNWPLESVKLKVDPFDANSNQASPIWYNSAGAGIFSDTYGTMGYSFNNPADGIFELYEKKSNRLDLEIVAGNNVREAFYMLSEIAGKPGVIPPRDYFAFPQFNTWIEFATAVNQDGIIKYVQEIRKNNFPASLFIIDDKWTTTYGDPLFDAKKFPDPEKMITFLHQNNFRIALWLTPFIEEKSDNFKYALDHHYLILNSDNNATYFTKWWNGTAALVDLSNPEAYAWFLGMLNDLKEKFGVDGFKLDAGDAEYLKQPFSSYGKITANEYADLFASLGTHFEANELRVSWRTQSMGLIQRLRDKAPSWAAADGIQSLVPHALAASLLGYSFVCPDMIGGGLDGGFKAKGYKLDEELFVRWAEASALMPMMQYSLAPWKLSPENILICRKYSDLHVSLGDYIYKLAEQSKADGSPIVRPLFFEFPDDEKSFAVKDEFMLGERFLVAPVLQKGAVSRDVYLPRGTWTDFWSGKVFRGGSVINYPAPLDVLPVFVRVE
jgi:myogenesis-regulating glycosidase